VILLENYLKLFFLQKKNARDLVAKRAALRRRLQLTEQEQREEELRKAAQQARLKRIQIQETAIENETEEETKNRIGREKIREDRRREREREHRLDNKGGVHKKSKLTRDQDRDISEKVALGQSVPKTTEALFDQRLFNQTEGLDPGFGDDENYNIYDKSLFGGERERALYKAPSKNDDELYGEKISMDKILKTNKFKPDKDFEGVDRTVPQETRNGPVQFEQDNGEQMVGENDDKNNEKNDEKNNDDKKEEDYGFDKYFTQAKKSDKKEKYQKLGVMHATGGSGVGSEMSQRKEVGFVKSTQVNTKKYRDPSPEKSPKRRQSRSKSPRNRSSKRKRSPSPKRSPRNRTQRSPKRRSRGRN